MSTPRWAATLVLAALASCGTSSEPPALMSDHPVPGGNWPPTTGDLWPASLEAAFEFTGCAGYGGIPIRTVIQAPTVVEVQALSGLDQEGNPVILINPSVLTSEALSRAFLYMHECAHHRLQHPALEAAAMPPDPVLREYEANCEAAAYGLVSGLLVRRDIDFLRLVLDNSSGPERPPGQGRDLLDCLGDRGLY